MRRWCASAARTTRRRLDSSLPFPSSPWTARRLAQATLDAAIVTALIGFVGTVAYATYVERGDPE